MRGIEFQPDFTAGSCCVGDPELRVDFNTGCGIPCGIPGAVPGTSYEVGSSTWDPHWHVWSMSSVRDSMEDPGPRTASGIPCGIPCYSTGFKPGAVTSSGCGPSMRDATLDKAWLGSRIESHMELRSPYEVRDTAWSPAWPSRSRTTPRAPNGIPRVGPDPVRDPGSSLVHPAKNPGHPTTALTPQ